MAWPLELVTIIFTEAAPARMYLALLIRSSVASRVLPLAETLLPM